MQSRAAYLFQEGSGFLFFEGSWKISLVLINCFRIFHLDSFYLDKRIVERYRQLFSFCHKLFFLITA